MKSPIISNIISMFLIFIVFSLIFFIYIVLYNSITNINTLAKSGKVTNISVQKQNVGSYTVTHNLGRPNAPVVTLNLGNSASYGWANTQATVYDVTNNDFKVKIFNDNANGTFSFNWVVVATD